MEALRFEELLAEAELSFSVTRVAALLRGTFGVIAAELDAIGTLSEKETQAELADMIKLLHFYENSFLSLSLLFHSMDKMKSAWYMQVVLLLL